MYICISVCSQRVDPKQCVHATSVLQSFCNIFCIHYTHIYIYIHGPSADRRSIGYVPEACAKKHVRDVPKKCSNHVQHNAQRMPRICPNQHKARCIYSSLDVYKFHGLSLKSGTSRWPIKGMVYIIVLGGRAKYMYTSICAYIPQTVLALRGSYP